MQNEFQLGDLVQLKSGGPAMTITEIRDDVGDDVVWCKWFANNKTESDSFPPLALKKADPSD